MEKSVGLWRLTWRNPGKCAGTRLGLGVFEAPVGTRELVAGLGTALRSGTETGHPT